MRNAQTLPQWQGGDARSFRNWLRTGLVLTGEEEGGVKFNPNHDELGRFASAPGGGVAAGGPQQRAAGPVEDGARALVRDAVFRPGEADGPSLFPAAAGPISNTLSATVTPPAPEYPAPVRGLPSAKRALSYTAVSRLVAENNKSGLSDNVVKALIYKESQFDPVIQNAGKGQHATGLMQINQTALNEIKRKLHIDYPLAAMTDPKANVVAGTQYLSILAARNHGVAATLDAYKGDGRTTYHIDIINAAKALANTGPNDPVSLLKRLFHR